MRRAVRFTMAFLLLTCLWHSSARAAIIFDNGPSAEATGSNISQFAIAGDFTLTSQTVVTGIRFEGFAGGTDLAANVGTTGDFSGIIGWAFHVDNGGLPGSILFSGADSSIPLTADGTNDGDFEYILDVDVPSVLLGPGTYWLQLREGAIGSASDGTVIYWSAINGINGPPVAFTSDEVAMTGWAYEIDLDPSFQLIGAVAVPEPSSMMLLGGGVAMMLTAARRRRSKPMLPA